MDMDMKLDSGHHRVGIETADVDGELDCGHHRMDIGAIDDPEVVELGMHLAGNGFKVVQSRKSKAKMRSRAATFGRDEALSETIKSIQYDMFFRDDTEVMPLSQTVIHRMVLKRRAKTNAMRNWAPRTY